MSFWQRLFEILGLGPRPARLHFEIDEELVASLQELAEQQQRPEDEVAAELLSYALARRDAAQASLQRWRGLTPREQQVTALICLGYTNREIAARLHISPETVKSHVRHALAKFDLGSKAELRQALADWDFSAWR